MSSSDVSSRVLREIRNQLVRVGCRNVIHDKEMPLIYGMLRRMETPGAIAHAIKEDRASRNPKTVDHSEAAYRAEW